MKRKKSCIYTIYMGKNNYEALIIMTKQDDVDVASLEIGLSYKYSMHYQINLQNHTLSIC